MSAVRTKIIGMSVNNQKFSFSCDLFLWDLFVIQTGTDLKAKAQVREWKAQYPLADSKVIQGLIIRTISKPSILKKYDATEHQLQIRI